MKKLLITVCLVSLVTCVVIAEPGDVLTGKNKALWQITTFKNTDFPNGLMAYILANMAGVPANYAADADVEEWIGWVRISFAQLFSKVFPKEIYNELVYAVELYQYGTPQVAAYRAAPTCTAGSGEITCQKDPTGNDRGLLVWRLVGGEYVEQDPGVAGYTTELVGDTWTISPLPAIGGVIIAYDDDFQSFPSFPMTVTAP